MFDRKQKRSCLVCVARPKEAALALSTRDLSIQTLTIKTSVVEAGLDLIQSKSQAPSEPYNFLLIGLV